MTVSSPIIHGNYDVVNAAQMWDPSITDQSIPNSYLYGSKPAFFYSLSWPPFDPANPRAALPTSIPAGYRFTNGNDPAAAPSAPTNLRIIPGS